MGCESKDVSGMNVPGAYPYQPAMKRVFEAPLYTGVKGQQYVKASELTKADIAKIQKCIKDFV
jgi:hypothetical protein